MKNKKSTVKDVAREAGITAQTVSNYLNNTNVVSKTTQKRIQEAIEKLHYTPNIFARGLRVGKSSTIAVIIPEIAHPFFSAIMNGIEEIVKKKGYNTVFASSGYEASTMEAELEKLSNYAEGIIICTNIVENKILKKIIKKRVPIVAIDVKIENGYIPSVEVDNYKAVKNGLQYLIDLGHKNIYYFSELNDLGITLDRLNAYKDSLKENNIEFDKSKTIIDKKLEIHKTQVGYKKMKDLLENMKMPAAVFATSDLTIMGAMKATIEKGYKIPDDISFLGNENIFLSGFINPPLTTIKQPKKEMGRVAAKMIFSLISKKRIKEKRVFLESTLIIRSTVKDLNSI